MLLSDDTRRPTHFLTLHILGACAEKPELAP